MRKFRGTIIIGITFLLLLGYFLIFYKGDNKEEIFKSMLDFNKEEIKEITLTSDKRDLAFIEESGKWYVKGKEKWLADQKLINDIVDKLSDLEAVGVIKGESLNLEDFGLGKNKKVLTIKTNDRTEKVYIGDKTPAGDLYFAKLPDKDTIFKVGKSRFEDLNYQADDYRNKQIFMGDKKNIKEIVINIKDISPIVLVKEGTWKIKGDSSAKVNDKKVNEFVSKLKDIRIKEYIHDKSISMAFYQLDNPSVVTTVKYKDGAEKIILGIADGTGGVFAKRDETNSVAIVPQESVQFFNNITKEYFIKK